MRHNKLKKLALLAVILCINSIPIVVYASDTKINGEITAQSNVLQSELSLMDIERKQLSAMVDLYRSLGGGWN